MYSPLPIILFCLLVPLLSIISKVLFSVWIYKDARKKNLQSVWWIIGVVFMSWIAFVIYLVYSKDKPEGSICPLCGTYNFHNGDFCVNCGNNVVRQHKEEKGLIYAGVITYVVAIILGILLFFFGMFSAIRDGYYSYPNGDFGYSFDYEFSEPITASYSGEIGTKI